MDKPRESTHMEDFWDARARENALFFVDSRLDYRHPDVDLFWAHGEADLETLLKLGGESVRPTDRVVEIGCGVGRLTRPLAVKAARVTAVDISSEMLARAQRLNRGLTNVTWIHGNGRTLAGIEDSSNDLCVSHVVFQHLPDPELTLGYVREMARVLVPGGRAVFCFSNDRQVHRPTSSPAIRQALLRLSGRGLRSPREQRDPAWLGSAVSLRDLVQTARAVGLDVESLEGRGTQYCVASLRRDKAV